MRILTVRLRIRIWWARHLGRHTPTARFAPHRWRRQEVRNGRRPFTCGCGAEVLSSPVSVESPLMRVNEELEA